MKIYQSLEQAHRAIFGYGIVPWEFRDAVRSWVFPGALAGLMAIGAPFGRGGYLFVPRLALSLLSVTPVALTFIWTRRSAGRAAAIVAALCVGVWFELVYFAPKALAEVVATHIMIVGLYCLLEHKCINVKRRAYVSGTLLSMAALLRLQLVPGIAAACVTQVIMGWSSRAIHIRRMRYLLLGAAPVIILFGVVDVITWRYPFRICLELFLHQHIIWQSYGNTGVLPFDAFLGISFANVWSMALVPLVLLSVRGSRGKLPLATAALAIFFSHSVVAHKEYRFDYPVVVIIIVLAAMGVANLVSDSSLLRVGPRLRQLLLASAFLLWSGISLGLALRFDMALIQVPMELNHSGRPWTVRKGALVGMREIGKNPGTCGVGMIYVGWGYVGGYSFLHRKIPMFEIRHRGELAKMSHFGQRLNCSRSGKGLQPVSIGALLGRILHLSAPRRLPTPGTRLFNQ